MTQYYHKKGNRITKFALLNLIADIMHEKAVAVVHTDEGYENEKQRIHFKVDGIRYVLDGVQCPDVEKGTITLNITSSLTGAFDKPLCYEAVFSLGEIRISTLEKIANEVYDLLWIPELNDDYDMVREDYINGFLDTYFYPEMKRYREAKQHRDLTYLGGKKWDDLSEHDKGVVADLEVDL